MKKFIRLVTILGLSFFACHTFAVVLSFGKAVNVGKYTVEVVEILEIGNEDFTGDMKDDILLKIRGPKLNELEIYRIHGKIDKDSVIKASFLHPYTVKFLSTTFKEKYNDYTVVWLSRSDINEILNFLGNDELTKVINETLDNKRY